VCVRQLPARADLLWRGRSPLPLLLALADEKLTKVAIDRAAKNGSHIGLAIGSVEEKVDSEALDNLTTAVIAGVIKGLK